MQQMVTFSNNDDYNISTGGNIKLDVSSMIGKETVFDYGTNNLEDATKPKKKIIKINDAQVASREDDLPATATNTPYKDSYAETDSVLKGSIMQIDMITNDLMSDIKDIRSSKTMKKKYDYLGIMHSSLGSLIGTKVSAARELNNSIKSAHDLEIKRAKEFKLHEEVDDVKAIMDTYNAFVSMPINTSPINNAYNNPLGPTTVDLTVQNSNLIGTALGANPDATFQNYINNMTPEQAMMMYEGNPDIKQVVVYNQDTYEKSFEIMNVRTGEILHGLPKRNTAMYMPDTVIDLPNKIARNINLDEVYDVVVVGKGDMAQY